MPYTPAMPHHIMYAVAPFCSPYHHQYHDHHKKTSNDVNRALWVGGLHHWMDENYLDSSFASAGEIVSVKVIRNKHTGASEGYGFVEFHSHDIAARVLEEFNGTTMPNTDQHFRLNWASFSNGEKKFDNNGPSDLSIFVGDLASDVTDTLLHETFSDNYPSVQAAKVIIDASTGRSKGYGFVKFGDYEERNKAMTEMNGVKCSSRVIRTGPATPKTTTSYLQQGISLMQYLSLCLIALR